MPAATIDLARFYFDVRDGSKFIRDENGLELSGVDQARDEAATTLAELVKGRLPGVFEYEIAIEVRDEAKEPLLRAMLRFEVQRLR